MTEHLTMEDNHTLYESTTRINSNVIVLNDKIKKALVDYHKGTNKHHRCDNTSPMLSYTNKYCNTEDDVYHNGY